MTTQEKENITCLKELIDTAIKDLEEYGYLHENTCNSFQEEECNCDMQGMKDFVTQWMDNVNTFWCEMTEAHRKHCTPDGNKELTRFLGKKNRVTSSPTE